VDLSQGDVDAFLAAEKVVPARRMEWEQPGKTQVLWRAPVEVDAAQEGTIIFFVNPALPRRWTFKLSLHRHEIYRVDVKPLINHSNPADRPHDCPGKVTASVHEHKWIAGLDLRCAYALENLSDADHRRILEEFCNRARIDFQPEYSDPVKGVQLEI
jgi:hypothetical protein